MCPLFLCEVLTSHSHSWENPFSFPIISLYLSFRLPHLPPTEYVFPFKGLKSILIFNGAYQTLLYHILTPQLFPDAFTIAITLKLCEMDWFLFVQLFGKFLAQNLFVCLYNREAFMLVCAGFFLCLTVLCIFQCSFPWVSLSLSLFVFSLQQHNSFLPLCGTVHLSVPVSWPFPSYCQYNILIYFFFNFAFLCLSISLSPFN